MSSQPPSGVETTVGARGVSKSGFEVAHFIAQKFWRDSLSGFLSLGQDDDQNLRALPNRDRGALVLNVTKHARHVTEIDKIVFDFAIGRDGKPDYLTPDPDSNKYLKKLYEYKALELERAVGRAELAGGSQAEIDARIAVEQEKVHVIYRRKETVALKYWETLYLGLSHQYS